MVNGNQKGKAGEREAAKVLNEIFGCQARRGQQYSGGSDSPDIVDAIPGVHIEVKRTETILLKKWEKQVTEDAGGKPRMIMHRYNRHQWWVMIPLVDLVPTAFKLVEFLRVRKK